MVPKISGVNYERRDSPQPENAVMLRLIIPQSLSENKHQNFANFFQNSLDIDLLACYNT